LDDQSKGAFCAGKISLIGAVVSARPISNQVVSTNNGTGSSIHRTHRLRKARGSYIVLYAGSFSLQLWMQKWYKKMVMALIYSKITLKTKRNA
jgi:hypothetical protein